MGVTARIEHHAVVTSLRLVQRIDQYALDVGLHAAEFDVRIAFPQPAQQVIERPSAIDVGLPLSLEVEVGAVEDQDFHAAAD